MQMFATLDTANPDKGNVILPPHIAEHSPRDLEWVCVDSVFALARGMFGIRAECERRCV
jgi:hypothetical protein